MLKVEAARWFKRMEDRDEDVIQQWRDWKEKSLKRYQEAYDQLNIQFF
jgi:arginyl-tRNA synthetase